MEAERPARIPVKVPDIGAEADQIRFVGWLKQVGELVQEDDDLFEIETDKANLVCAAEAAGRLVEQVVTEPGQVVEIDQVVGWLEPVKPES